MNKSDSKDILSLIKSIVGEHELPSSPMLETGAKELTTRKNLLKSLVLTYENISQLENISHPHFRLSKFGAVVFQHPPTSSFFSQRKRFDEKDGELTNRGYEYCLFADKSIEDLLVYKTTFFEVFKEAATELKARVLTLEEEIAILDYIRIYLLTLFHAIVICDRNSDQTFDSGKLFEKLCVVIESYYHKLFIDAAFTVDYDKFFENVESLLGKSFGYLQKYDCQMSYFKYPEIDNPKVIYDFARTVVKKNDTPSSVLGITTGGTEMVILLRYLFQKRANVSVGIEITSISRYTLEKVTQKKGGNAPKSIISIPSSSDDTLIIVDDNSNTGSTLHLATQYYKDRYKKIKAFVAEFDPFRVLYKNENFVESPKTMANPYLFECSVNIAPISYDEEYCLPFKQLRKLWRTDVVLRYYSHNFPQYHFTNTSDLPRPLGCELKVCGIHNLADFNLLYQKGVKWFGVHCLYEDKNYAAKIQTSKNPYLINAYDRASSYIVGNSTGLPLVEVGAIKEMLQRIQDSDLNVNFVFLVDLVKFPDIYKVIDKYLIPKNYSKNVFFQLQNRYTAHAVQKLKNDSLGCVKTIQVVSTKDKEPEALLSDINRNDQIDFVLFDSAQYGGTGKVSNLDVLKKLITQTTKQVFVAGGINEKNVRNYLEELSKVSTNLGLDVESGIESEKVYLFASPAGGLIKARKDSIKVNDFFSTVTKALVNVKHSQRYEALKFKTDSTFKQAFINSWKVSKEQKGYYSASKFIDIFINHLSQNLESQAVDTSVLEHVCRTGLLAYNYLPAKFQGNQEGELKTVYERENNIPWLMEGVPEFFSYLSQSNNFEKLIIWTRGENSEFNDTPEQYLKASRSGLFSMLSIYNLAPKVDFSASPDKEILLNEYASFQSDIIVVDNELSNLNYVQANGDKWSGVMHLLHFCPHENSGRIDKRIVQVCDFNDVMKYLSTINNKYLLISDMDGVLLHEKFRNEHQPKNLFFELESRGYVQDTELFHQKNEIVDLDLVKLENGVQFSDPKIFLISGPSGSGKSSVIQEVLRTHKNVRYLKRITTRSRRYEEFHESSYTHVNETYFKALMKYKEMLEYGYFGPGYYGTTITDFLNAINSSEKVLFEADVDTVLFVSQILTRLNLEHKSIMILPTSVAEVEESIPLLKERIENRKDFQSDEELVGRVQKGQYTISLVHRFDEIIVNEFGALEVAVNRLGKIIFSL